MKEFHPLNELVAMIDTAEDELTRLRAENERLREALETLSLCDGNSSNVASAEILATRVRRIARAALHQEQEK